jgi:DNA-binding NarL/FixJ family response regulator
MRMTLLKIFIGSVLGAMLFAAFANDNLPYGYYKFLRIESFILFLILCAFEFKKQKFILAIIFGSCSLLFNPIYLITFSKSTWQDIDGLICGLVVIWIISEITLSIIDRIKKRKISIPSQEVTSKDISSSKAITVIHCDHFALFRKGVRTFLNNGIDFNFFDEVSNGVELLNLLQKKVPDVILLDIQLPVMNGIDTIVELRKQFPTLKVIFLSMYIDKKMITQVMELGANSYLSKNSSSEEIAKAIKCVHQYGYFYSPAIASVLYDSKKMLLSEKETMVLGLLKANKTHNDIANTLEIGERTVAAIIDTIKRKTGSKTMDELLNYETE